MLFVSATFTGQLNSMFLEKFGKTGIKKLIEKKTHMNLANISHEFIHCTTFDKKEPALKLLREVLSKIKKL
jgi:hypothetical protein